MRITVDTDDALAAEVERLAPNATWQSIIIDSLAYALAMADNEQHDSEPSDDEASEVEQT